MKSQEALRKKQTRKTRLATRKWVVLAASALFATSLSVNTADAEMTLKANSQYSDVQSASKIDKWWAEEISKRTDGEVNVKIFFSGALGKAQENLTLLQDGAIELAMMSPGYFPAELPFHAAPNSIPMAMSGVEDAYDLMTRLMTTDSDILEKEAAANGIKPLFFHYLNPYKLVCNKQISSLDQLSGLKIRTWGKDLPRAMEAVGATPVTLMFPDIYEALGRGTVDCIPVSVDLHLNYKFYEVAKHLHDVTIWVGPTAGTWIHLDAWNKLTPDQQAIIEQVSFEAMEKDRDATLAAAGTAIEELKSLGMQFHDFPEADAAMWKEKIPDFFGDFIDDMEALGRGEDARRMIAIWNEVTE